MRRFQVKMKFLTVWTRRQSSMHEVKGSCALAEALALLNAKVYGGLVQKRWNGINTLGIVLWIDFPFPLSQLFSFLKFPEIIHHHIKRTIKFGKERAGRKKLMI